MIEQIVLTFTEDHKYQLEFSPSSYWMEFAKGYGGLTWIEIGDEKAVVVAENYSYLLDLLVQGRLYHLSKIPHD